LRIKAKIESYEWEKRLKVVGNEETDPPIKGKFPLLRSSDQKRFKEKRELQGRLYALSICKL
jgi:hypothetical protein